MDIEDATAASAAENRTEPSPKVKAIPGRRRYHLEHIGQLIALDYINQMTFGHDPGPIARVIEKEWQDTIQEWTDGRLPFEQKRHTIERVARLQVFNLLRWSPALTLILNSKQWTLKPGQRPLTQSDLDNLDYAELLTLAVIPA